MRYISTRGRMPQARFTDVLLEGLAPDGGLVVPAYYPQVDAATLTRWRTLDYATLATEILSLFCDDLDRATLDRLTHATYTRAVFGTDDITPVAPLDGGLSLLRLSNGPTLAFKDMAMQLLGALFEHVLAARSATLNVLGATSGDTGSAAEYALRGVDNHQRIDDQRQGGIMARHAERRLAFRVRGPVTLHRPAP